MQLRSKHYYLEGNIYAHFQYEVLAAASAPEETVAFVGGYVGTFLGLGAVTGFNIGSLLLATGGGVILLALYRVIKK